MKPKLIEGCSLFTFDRDTMQFGVIDPELVGVKFEEGRAVYYLLNADKNLIIVQAINIKKASAKMLTIITHEKKAV